MSRNPNNAYKQPRIRRRHQTSHRYLDQQTLRAYQESLVYQKIQKKRRSLEAHQSHDLTQKSLLDCFNMFRKTITEVKVKPFLVMLTLSTYMMLRAPQSNNTASSIQSLPIDNAIIDPIQLLSLGFTSQIMMAMQPAQLCNFVVFLMAMENFLRLQCVSGLPTGTLQPISSTTVLITSIPSTAELSTAEPSTAEPSTANPSTANPSTAEPSTAEPSTAEPSTAEPSTAKPSTAEPSTAEPSTANPSTAEPSTANPSTAKPSTAEPSTAKPSTAKPSTANPSTAKPSTPITSTGVTLVSEYLLAVLTNGTKISFLATNPLDQLSVEVQFPSTLSVILLLSSPVIKAVNPFFDQALNLFRCSGNLADVTAAFNALRQSSSLTYAQAQNTPITVRLSDNNGLSFVSAEGNMGLLGNNTAPQLVRPFPPLEFPLNQAATFDATPYWMDPDGDEINIIITNGTLTPLQDFIIRDGATLGGQTNVPATATLLSIASDWGKENASLLNAVWKVMSPAVLQLIAPQQFPVGQQMSYSIPTDTFNLAVTSMAVANLPQGLAFVLPNSIIGTPVNPGNVSLLVFGTNGYKTVNTTMMVTFFAILTRVSHILGMQIAAAEVPTTIIIPSDTFISPYSLIHTLVLLQNDMILPIPSWARFIAPNQLNIVPSADQLGQNFTFGDIATNPYGDTSMARITVQVPPNIPPQIGFLLPDLVCFVNSFCQYIILVGAFNSTRPLTYTASAVSGNNNTSSLGSFSFDANSRTLSGMPVDSVLVPFSMMAGYLQVAFIACDNVNACISQSVTIVFKYSIWQMIGVWTALAMAASSFFGIVLTIFMNRANIYNYIKGRRVLIRDPFEGATKFVFPIEHKNKTFVDFYRKAKPGERFVITRFVAYCLKPFSGFLYDCLMLARLDEKSKWVIYKRHPQKSIKICAEKIQEADVQDIGPLYLFIRNDEGRISRVLRVDPALFYRKNNITDDVALELPELELSDNEEETPSTSQGSADTAAPETEIAVPSVPLLATDDDVIETGSAREEQGTPTTPLLSESPHCRFFTTIPMEPTTEARVLIQSDEYVGDPASQLLDKCEL